MKPTKLDTGKSRLDLIVPEFTIALGNALAYGADKYCESISNTPNYLQGDGLYYSRLIASMERHTQEFKMGIEIDEESGLDHIIQVAVNAMMLYTYTQSNKGIDNRLKLTKGLHEKQQDTSEGSKNGRNPEVKE